MHGMLAMLTFDAMPSYLLLLLQWFTTGLGPGL